MAVEATERRTAWGTVKSRADSEKRHFEVDVELLPSNSICLSVGTNGHFHLGGITNHVFPIVDFINESGSGVRITPTYELTDGRILSEGNGNPSRTVRTPSNGIRFGMDPSNEVRAEEVKKATFNVVCLDPIRGFSITLNVRPQRPN